MGRIADATRPFCSDFSVQTSALPAGLALPAAAAVVPAASATAAVSAATAAAATAASASAASAESTFWLRPGFVHHERTSIHLVLVELGDGLRRVLVIHHFDEREPAGAAGRHVPHHPDVVHLAGLAEQLRELIVRG